MTTRRKYWLHFITPKQPTAQARAQVEAQTALNFGLMTSDTLFRLRGFEDKERGQSYGLLASEWHRAAN